MKVSPIRRTIGLVAALGVVAVLPGGIGGADQQAAPKPWEKSPSPTEYALLALANMERADRGTLPMVWNSSLGFAAREHVWERIEHGCNSHNCGEVWSKRVSDYYPGWWALGENMTGGGGARDSHNGWMGSPGHRGNILSANYREFGAGFDVAWDTPSRSTYATEDFGSRGSVTIPVIPAGAVLEPQNWGASNWDWELLVNYYDKDGRAPTKVEAVMDSTRQTLTTRVGSPSNGTWKGTLRTPAFPQDCTRVHFEIQRSGDGATFRWPTSGSIGIGPYPSCYDPYSPMTGVDPPPGTTTTTTGATTTTTTIAPPPPGSVPHVVIDSPVVNTTVSGTIEVRAHATDDGVVKRIELYVDGKRLGRREGGVLVRKWSAGAAKYTPGPHTIEVRAYDDAGNVGTASIAVTK